MSLTNPFENSVPKQTPDPDSPVGNTFGDNFPKVDPLEVTPVDQPIEEITVGLRGVDKKLTPVVSDSGDIVLCRQESGSLIPVKNMGGIKEFYRQALRNASLMRMSDKIDLSQLSHIEVAAVMMAKQAAQGDTSAAKELLDRELGKPTNFTENKNLNMTLDDVLNSIPSQQSQQPHPRSSIFDVEVE